MAKPARDQRDEPRGVRSGVRRALRAITGDAQSTAFDPLIHERVRLGILGALAVASPMSFNDVKALLEISDGNLSVHARKLEDAGYVAVKKRFEGRVPRTDYAITAAGRAALKAYLAHMEALIGAVGE
ncbi:MAG: winged helix-turn-helix domain-containing protein [Gemmatimonadota bacterium]